MTPAAAGPAGQPGEGTGERQVPFFCPYCGEEGLRPAGAEPGTWACHACSRSFRLRFSGLLGSGVS